VIGLDTNVLVRYITQDDPSQAKKATALIENELSVGEPGFVTLITLVELIWVLDSCYAQNKETLLLVLERLLTTRQLVVEKADCAQLAMKRYAAAAADFSDTLIAVLSEQVGCKKVVTFDKKALTTGMTLL
jgi:predicted nucleic-acid-binding protein